MHWCVCATILRILSYASAFICQTNNIFELAQDLLLTAVSPSVLLAPHEVSVQFCLGDQEVQLPLLTLSLMGHTGRTVRMML